MFCLRETIVYCFIDSVIKNPLQIAMMKACRTGDDLLFDDVLNSVTYFSHTNINIELSFNLLM